MKKIHLKMIKDETKNCFSVRMEWVKSTNILRRARSKVSKKSKYDIAKINR